MRRLRSRTLLAATVLTLVAAGCGGGDGEGEGTVEGVDRAARERAQPLGELLAGSVAPLAQCKDWVGGPRDRQLATVDDIRNQVSRDDTNVIAPALTDEEALGVFDRACANSFAKSFRLYVLYARAAGFAPLTR